VSDLQCAATLVVARHGAAEYTESWFSDEGGTLTAAGRRQACALAASLAGRRVARIWSSDSSRAVQTAEIVAARLAIDLVTTRKPLREVSLGELLGRPFDARLIHEVTDHWYAGDLSPGFPGGENGDQVVARYHDQLEEIADQHRGETVLVITHQTATCVALPALADNLRPSYAREHELGNGQAVELMIDGDGWRVTRWAGREC
jgi:broad specificity phosphatase PhoE